MKVYVPQRAIGMDVKTVRILKKKEKKKIYKTSEPLITTWKVDAIMSQNDTLAKDGSRQNTSLTYWLFRWNLSGPIVV